jgi:transcriptional regulator of met regulon
MTADKQIRKTITVSLPIDVFRALQSRAQRRHGVALKTGQPGTGKEAEAILTHLLRK